MIAARASLAGKVGPGTGIPVAERGEWDGKQMKGGRCA